LVQHVRTVNIARRKTLMKVLVRVKQQLINKFNVEKMIPFGSFAVGNVHEWSYKEWAEEYILS